MARAQVQDPLSNNAPQLRPTSRPIGVGVGARPPARIQDNGLMQLASALGEFQPALRQMLADRAQKDQEAALTVGELKAAELSAEQRMQEINSKFKTYVDDGTVPKSMLPYFQIGFSKRTGRELALTEFQSALDARYKEATSVDGRVDPEAIIGDTLKTFRERLPQGDIYTTQGFDGISSQVAQSFRERANNEYRQNYERAGEVRIANEGLDLLQQFVLASNTPAPLPSAPKPVEAGNIDLSKRPIVKNSDSSISTVRSVSFGTDKGEILVPTITPDGKTMTPEQALERYRATGEHLGIFKSAEDATSYAQYLHEEQAQRYAPDSAKTEKQAKLEEFRSYFNGLKTTELPKAGTAPFIVKNVVSPMVDDLVARGDFDGAEELVHQMEQFDVTGQGGLLGNMAATKGALAQMKLEIGERKRGHDATDLFEKQVRSGYFKGEADAKVALVELGDKPLDPASKQTLIAKYRETNQANPWAISRYSDYLDEVSRKGMSEDQPSAVASVARLLNSVDPKQLAQAKDLLAESSRTGQISPLSEIKLSEQIKKNEQLVGIYEPKFREIAAKNIYLASDPTDPRQKMPQFKTADAYSKLTPDQKQLHETEVLDYFDNHLKELIRAKGEPEVAKQEISKLMEIATNNTVKFADSVTAKFEKQNEEIVRVKKREAERVRQYQAQPIPAFLKEQRPVQPDGAKGFLSLVPSRYWLPVQIYSELFSGKQYYATRGSVQYPDDLKELAAFSLNGEAQVEKYRVKTGPAKGERQGMLTGPAPSPETVDQAVERASLKYAYLKSLSGFKPEEIIKKTTAEGVQIDPAQIDYRRVPVFESLAQLDKEWNQGKPAEGGLFHQLGDFIDPANTIDAREFYAAQRAILANRK
jgi:hypothetical protein